MTKLLVVCVTVLLSAQGFSKDFSNSYIDFVLPPGWHCQIEGSEWVCQSQTKDRQKEAIIILAAKQRGSQDDIAQYKKYLEKVKTYKLPGGKIQKSEVKYSKMTNINGHEWIDSLHLASEIPGFFTRYLASTKGDIGVAVTFSVTKSMYPSYKKTFDNVITSMRIRANASPKLAGFRPNRAKGASSVEGATMIGEAMPVGIGSGPITQQGGGKSSSKGSLALYAILALAGIIFVAIKFKKK